MEISMKQLPALLIASVGLFVNAEEAVAQAQLKCAARGYTATYTPARRGVPPMVDVTFSLQRPTSAAADAALRKCLNEVATTMFVAEEVMGTVWFGDDTVALPDRSNHLMLNPKTKAIRTWNERQGATRATSEGAGYFVEYEEKKVLVKPGGTFASIDVVFAKAPTEKAAYEAVIAEVLKAVSRTKGAIRITAFAQSGARSNPSSWKQVRGADGKFISAEFDPKRPMRLAGAGGQDLGVQVQIPAK
jgi:hypothetical protein